MASAGGFTDAPSFDAQAWASSHGALFDLTAGEAGSVIEHWRDVAAAATGLEEIELAGPFQRHLTARGTGVPTNFCLALVPGQAVAFGFDPAVTEHPLATSPGQFKDEQARWPRDAVRAVDVERGRMAWGVRFEIAGAKPIPCRTPRLTRNPAAAAVISQLGGELPG